MGAEAREVVEDAKFKTAGEGFAGEIAAEETAAAGDEDFLWHDFIPI